jgi:Tfp pilus assembly protein PilZ
MSEKRTKPRFGPLVLKARLETDGGSFEGYLTNVSTSGAFLAMDTPPAIGTEISIRAPLPWNLGELRAQARVVWRDDPNSAGTRARVKINGVGLAFTQIEKGSEDALDAYLQRFAELAAQLDESTAAHDGH